MKSQALTTAVAALREGQVIAYPTEAVWGLGCDPFNEVAVRALLRIKERAVDKGLLLVGAEVEQLSSLLAPLDAAQKQRLRESWPGPVTWLIPDPEGSYPAWIRGSHSSVAIRISAHPLVRALCREFQGLVVSTSANRAGQDPIRDETTLRRSLGPELGYVLSGDLGDQDQPSEIRDLLSDRVLRSSGAAIPNPEQR